ncbi:MAG: TfoX/Sxy family protein [Lachnospiraceae bacterium]
MASSKEYLNFIMDQLSGLQDISCRMMMGEYMIYYRGKLVAYVCDDRLLVKPLESVKRMIPDAPYEPPYEGAKDMVLVEDIDNRDFLQELFEEMYEELPAPKPKKEKRSKR